MPKNKQPPNSYFECVSFYLGTPVCTESWYSGVSREPSLSWTFYYCLQIPVLLGSVGSCITASGWFLNAIILASWRRFCSCTPCKSHRQAITAFIHIFCLPILIVIFSLWAVTYLLVLRGIEYSESFAVFATARSLARSRKVAKLAMDLLKRSHFTGCGLTLVLLLVSTCSSWLIWLLAVVIARTSAVCKRSSNLETTRNDYHGQAVSLRRKEIQSLILEWRGWEERSGVFRDSRKGEQIERWQLRLIAFSGGENYLKRNDGVGHVSVCGLQVAEAPMHSRLCVCTILPSRWASEVRQRPQGLRRCQCQQNAPGMAGPLRFLCLSRMSCPSIWKFFRPAHSDDFFCCQAGVTNGGTRRCSKLHGLRSRCSSTRSGLRLCGRHILPPTAGCTLANPAGGRQRRNRVHADAHPRFHLRLRSFTTHARRISAAGNVASVAATIPWTPQSLPGSLQAHSIPPHGQHGARRASMDVTWLWLSIFFMPMYLCSIWS